MLFRQIYDEALAQAAYLIGCQRTGEALVIDPERDVERYIEAAEREGLRITAITETHIHADFLSGARELAERTGATLYLSDEGGPDWSYEWLDKRSDGGAYRHRLLRDGDEFVVGNIRIGAIHTPGHTPEHLSFTVTDIGGGATEPMGVATGDFVFVGDVGRPDLLETAAGEIGAKEPAARLLHESLQRFADLPEFLQVWPGHGAGSACGKALGAVPQSTVGYELRNNASLLQTRTGREAFVSWILSGQPEPPVYFARMKRLNRSGPDVLGSTPEPAEVPTTEALRLVDSSRTVIVDTRSWARYRVGHLRGSLHIPLDRSFSTVAGSFIDPSMKILLIAEPDELHEVVVRLIRVGLDSIVGYVTPDALERLLGAAGGGVATRQISAAEFALTVARGEGSILDVRNATEFIAGHIAGAVNIAHTQLAIRQDEIPATRPMFLHCLSGARSAVAAAFLERIGRPAVYVAGTLDEIVQAGVPLIAEPEAVVAEKDASVD